MAATVPCLQRLGLEPNQLIAKKVISYSALLRHPIDYLKQRLTRWWQARLPRCDRLVLTQRNVYIMPTRAGLMLAATLLVLLVASINYQLNLGYLLTFLLAGCALVSMHVSHGTLRGLALHLVTPAAVHAGDKAVFDVYVHNPSRRTRYAIALAVQDAQPWVWTNVAGQASARVQLAFVAPRRGLHALPTVTAQTLFPMGTFRVWMLWRPATQLLVYPRPEEPAPPLPYEPGGDASGGRNTLQPPSDPNELRPYRQGDTLKSIVWKKVAKTGELVSRSGTSQQQQHTLWLAPHQTGLSQPEQQLSRLCAWVLQAEQQGLHYGLRLGGVAIAPDGGAGHQQRCLKALALA